MKVLLLNQFFHPDLAPTSQLATDLGEDLVAAGLEVTALASRGSYLGGGTLPARDRHGGIDIVRVAATSLGRRSLLHRALDYASFYVASCLALARLPRQDVVIVMTTPPLIAAAGLLAKALRGTRLVYWVQDLYPEVAVAFGALRARSAAARVMAWISRAVLRRSDRVVALGEEMRARCIAAGARPDRAVVVPSWSDAEEIRPVPHGENPLRPTLSDGARVLVMYSGNMGRAHDLTTLVAAAARLAHRTDIRFVFAGEGVKRSEAEEASRALPNVRFAPYQPRERLAQALSAADLHLISLSPAVEGLLEPSKLYGVMAAGRPALFVGPPGSEVARTIVREACGMTFHSGDAGGLASAIESLADDDAARERMGASGRRALEERYARSVATARFLHILADLSPSATKRRRFRESHPHSW